MIQPHQNSKWTIKREGGHDFPEAAAINILEAELLISFLTSKDVEQKFSEIFYPNICEKYSLPVGDHIWGYIDFP